MFKFLNRVIDPPASTGPASVVQPAARVVADPPVVKTEPEPIAPSRSQGGPASEAPAAKASLRRAGKTTADFEPLAGVMGAEAAQQAMARLATAKPRTAWFIAAPRTAAHREAVRALIIDAARARAETDAIVAVHDFDTDEPRIMRLPVAAAREFAMAVADAIEMLSVTVPAAYDSDSARVARAALEEEVRSGHDGAIDALRRRALAQNIGLLRTPQGYAIAPMHDGRVVAAEIFNTLPETLKADVEAKLTSFQGELATVLQDRARLQQEYCERLRTLDREVASLAVRAALARPTLAFAAHPSAVTYLDALREDLTRNAALFGTTSEGRQARAPIDIARDPALGRYRVAILTPVRNDDRGVEVAISLDRADLAGEASRQQGTGPLMPTGVQAGALARVANGILIIDAADLLAQYNAWPLVKQALDLGSVVPSLAGASAGRMAGPALPVACRIAVVGELEDYATWCRLDRDVPRLVSLIKAFDAFVPRTQSEERFGRHVAAIVAEDGVPALEAAALAALIEDQTVMRDGVSSLSTDLDSVRDIIAAAATIARSDNRANLIIAADITAAITGRLDALGLVNRAGAA